jgi:hypothetical protein
MDWDTFMRDLPALDSEWQEVMDALNGAPFDPPFAPKVVTWGRMRKKFYKRAGMCIKVFQARPDEHGIWRYQPILDVGKVIWGTDNASKKAELYAVRNGMVYAGRIKPGTVAWNP